MISKASNAFVSFVFSYHEYDHAHVCGQMMMDNFIMDKCNIYMQMNAMDAYRWHCYNPWTHVYLATHGSSFRAHDLVVLV